MNQNRIVLSVFGMVSHFLLLGKVRICKIFDKENKDLDIKVKAGEHLKHIKKFTTKSYF